MRDLGTRSVVAATLSLALAAPVRGQSLAQRVVVTDGAVEVVYPSRPGVCGDGAGAIGNLFGHSMYFSGTSTYSSRDGWRNRPCEPGPVRLVASVASGEVTRLRPFVGALPAPVPDARRIATTAADAAAWLTALVTTGSGRVASDAMLPLILADAPDPWPLLLRVARDDTRSRASRQSALLWLANGIDQKLGLDDDRAATDDDEMRQQAVFVLSQRPKSESIPELIDLARHGKYPAVRRSAIFWLGQSGDPRAADVYAELLGAK